MADNNKTTTEYPHLKQLSDDMKATKIDHKDNTEKDIDRTYYIDIKLANKDKLVSNAITSMTALNLFAYSTLDYLNSNRSQINVVKHPFMTIAGLGFGVGMRLIMYAGFYYVSTAFIPLPYETTHLFGNTIIGYVNYNLYLGLVR